MNISSKSITKITILKNFLRNDYWTDTIDISLSANDKDEFQIKHYATYLSLETKLEVFLFMFCFIALPSFIVFLYFFCKESRQNLSFKHVKEIEETQRLNQV